MTEIELHQPAPIVMATGAATIAATARALVDAHQIGTALCRTAFVPKHFQGKPDDAAAAILYGSTIDMDPVTALQNIYVIGGKPALYARTMAAIVMSHGHDLWTEEEAEGRVTVAGKRKGSEHVERVTWTSEMAQKAGYTSNANYKSNPRAMLYARASGDVARRIAPDALLGMAHNVEELTISEPWDGTTTAPRQAVGKTAAERMGAILTPQTSGEGVAPDDIPASPSHPSPSSESPFLNTSSALARRMFALMGEVGVTAREDRLLYASDTLGREISSSKEMTEADALAVIASLEHDKEPIDAEIIEDPLADVAAPTPASES